LRRHSVCVPTKEELAEIEATSRLRTEKDALYMTAPLIFAAGKKPWLSALSGFVLSKRVLLTVRFEQSLSFDAVNKEATAAARVEPAYTLLAFLKS
jgi:magnesium transporter